MSHVILSPFSAPVVAALLAGAAALTPAAAQGPAFSTTMFALGPAYRYGHTGAYDLVRGRTVTFGGLLDAAVPTSALGDTCEWDGAWIQRQPAHSPPPRYGHAMTYMPGIGVVVLGGTPDGTSCHGDMWRWDGQDWHQMTPPLMPPKLQGAAIAYHDGPNPGILLFGGKDSGQTLSNETWLFDGSNWSLRSSSGPGPRWQAGMACAGSVQRTYLIGGFGPGTANLEAWMWDGFTWTPVNQWPLNALQQPTPLNAPAVVWEPLVGRLYIAYGPARLTALPNASAPAAVAWTQSGIGWLAWATEVYDAARQRIVHIASLGFSPRVLEVPSNSGAMLVAEWNTAPPTPRTYFDATYSSFYQRTFVFGGWSGTAPLNDTWSFDGVSWTNHGPSNVAARIAPALFTFGWPMMFGGGTFTGSYFDDLTYWDGTDWRPAGLFALSARPAARMCHDMVIDTSQQRVVMFGGTNGMSLSDTWTLNSSWVGAWWQQIATAGPQPPARNSHRMAYDQQRQRVVMFGGCNAWGGFLGDTWELVGNTWQQVFPAESPSPRWQHMMEYDPQRGVVVLIGGYYNGVFLNDVWEFDGATWTRRTPESTVPAGREGAASAWDATRNRFVLCGGYSWATGVLNDAWFYSGR